MEAITMDHRIVILGDKAKVKPGTVIVGVGDIVTFESHDTDAVVSFPPGLAPFASSSLNVPAVGICAPQIVNGAPGVYAYSAYCTRHRHFALGESDPIIIIKR